MTEGRVYVEAEGETHLVAPETGGEHTLCGDAFDLDSDVPGYAWTPRKGGPVTCSRCAAIVLYCRGVRVAEA